MLISELQLPKFAFRSKDVKKILDGEDLELFIPLIFTNAIIKLPLKLSTIYRFLFRRGLFPVEQKIGNAVLIPKGFLSGDKNNY